MLDHSDYNYDAEARGSFPCARADAAPIEEISARDFAYEQLQRGRLQPFAAYLRETPCKAGDDIAFLLLADKLDLPSFAGRLNYMQMLGPIVNLFHGLSETVIFVIICGTILMCVFLWKILFDSDFFSSYDRNL